MHHLCVHVGAVAGPIVLERHPVSVDLEARVAAGDLGVAQHQPRRRVPAHVEVPRQLDLPACLGAVHDLDHEARHPLC